VHILGIFHPSQSSVAVWDTSWSYLLVRLHYLSLYLKHFIFYQIERYCHFHKHTKDSLCAQPLCTPHVSKQLGVNRLTCRTTEPTVIDCQPQRHNTNRFRGSLVRCGHVSLIIVSSGNQYSSSVKRFSLQRDINPHADSMQHIISRKLFHLSSSELCQVLISILLTIKDLVH
jgi:hypothetical protein